MITDLPTKHIQALSQRQTFLGVLTTRWRQKSTGIKQNDVTVTLFITWKSLSERDVVCTVQMANALSTFDNDGGGTTEADVNENDMPPPPPDADKLWWTVHTSPRLTDDSRFRPGSVHTNRVHGPCWNTCRRATLFLFTGLICGP